jgi:hypothetical protein
MTCPECKREMELIDTTYSNYDSGRCYKGQHTGDIYECKAVSNYILIVL